MKPYKQSIYRKIANFYRTQPKVLLWTLWRSGTHWLADMLSDMMDIPAVYQADNQENYKKETIDQLKNYQRNTILVRHLCLPPQKLFKHASPLGFKVIFLYRDPRDVIASHINMRKYREGKRPGLPVFSKMGLREILKWELERFDKLYNKVLPQWVEFEHEKLIKIRYEDLVKRTLDCLERISRFLNLKISKKKLEKIIKDNSFEQRTGRSKGDEDKRAHERKGIIGDYKNQFSAKEQALINRRLEQAIIRSGYHL